MSGGWAGSDRRSRLPKNWDSIRVQILRRDSYICTWHEDGVRCHHRATDVDHVINNDDHRPSNLRSLCEPHHRIKSAREGAAARTRLKRPKPRHPGLL